MSRSERIAKTKKIKIMTSHGDNIDRDACLESHPVVSAAYILITPMIAKVYSILRERVFSRHTGTFLYGTPRKGKTKCATTITDLLEIEFPRKYILYHSADGHKSAHLVRDLITDLGLSSGQKDHSALLERFIVHVRIRVESLGGSHFVLIIDENQLLSTDSWTDLLVIHNRLEGHGVSMTTLGFGQEQILQKIEFLFRVNLTNLVARFLCEPILFDGCVSEADLKSILNEYDVNKEFPLDSGCTYTQFFLPKAFAANFRMTSCNKKIWSELMSVAGEEGPGILPLEHIFRIIERILIRCRHMDCSEFQVTEGIVKEAVAASLIAQFVAMMHQSEKNGL